MSSLPAASSDHLHERLGFPRAFPARTEPPRASAAVVESQVNSPIPRSVSTPQRRSRSAAVGSPAKISVHPDICVRAPIQPGRATSWITDRAREPSSRASVNRPRIASRFPQTPRATAMVFLSAWARSRIARHRRIPSSTGIGPDQTPTGTHDRCSSSSPCASAVDAWSAASSHASTAAANCP